MHVADKKGITQKKESTETVLQTYVIWCVGVLFWCPSDPGVLLHKQVPNFHRISAKENIDRWGQKNFLSHIGPKTNDNPYETKVRPEKKIFDTPLVMIIKEKRVLL